MTKRRSEVCCCGVCSAEDVLTTVTLKSESSGAVTSSGRRECEGGSTGAEGLCTSPLGQVWLRWGGAQKPQRLVDGIAVQPGCFRVVSGQAPSLTWTSSKCLCHRVLLAGAAFSCLAPSCLLKQVGARLTDSKQRLSINGCYIAFRTKVKFYCLWQKGDALLFCQGPHLPCE